MWVISRKETRADRVGKGDVVDGVGWVLERASAQHCCTRASVGVW